MPELRDALILSAGWGTRLRPLTLYRPKVLAPFKEKPLLQTWIDILAACGIRRIFVNFHALSTCFKHFLECIDVPSNVELCPIFEKSILGSGGSILNVIKRFRPSSLVVVNGDTVLNPASINFPALLEQWNGRIWLALTDNELYNNIVLDSAGNIIRFRSRTTQHEQKAGFQCLAFMGIHIIESQILRDIKWNKEFADIIEIYQVLALEGYIRYKYFPNAQWYDLGTPQMYFQAHFIGEHNNCYVGSGSIIYPDAQLRQCILWDNVVVKKNACLHSCIVLDGVVVDKTATNSIITRHGCYKL